MSVLGAARGGASVSVEASASGAGEEWLLDRVPRSIALARGNFLNCQSTQVFSELLGRLSIVAFRRRPQVGWCVSSPRVQTNQDLELQSGAPVVGGVLVAKTVVVELAQQLDGVAQVVVFCCTTKRASCARRTTRVSICAYPVGDLSHSPSFLHGAVSTD